MHGREERERERERGGRREKKQGGRKRRKVGRGTVFIKDPPRKSDDA